MITRAAFFVLLAAGWAGAAEYKGKVGNLDAIFNLEWKSETTLDGTYQYPKRPGITYRLSGSNPKDGYIQLKEWTGENLSAICELHKKLENDTVTWEGVMHNTDGRKLPMFFSRVIEEELVTPKMETQEPQNPTPGRFSIHELATQLGTPDNLEANLYGNLYYGWLIDGSIEPESSIGNLISNYRKFGQPIWAAMRFSQGKVQLHYETSDSGRRILNGTNPANGQIELTGPQGQRWSLGKRNQENLILWEGGTKSEPAQSLLLYRQDIQLADGLAPEAFLWNWNVGGTEFYNARFAYKMNESSGIRATVVGMDDSNGLIRSIDFTDEKEQFHTLQFDKARPANRVPLAIGFPVSIYFNQGRIASLDIELSPVSWRKAGSHTIELLVVSTPQANFQFDDFLNPVFPPGRFESLTKIIVAPDFAILTDNIVASWYVNEDKIVWSVGDRGPGMLELEGISLESLPEPVNQSTSPHENRKSLPWHQISETIDFPNNQTRILNVNDTSGYNYVLPGNAE